MSCIFSIKLFFKISIVKVIHFTLKIKRNTLFQLMNDCVSYYISICNSSTTFEGLMEMLLRGLTCKTGLIYLDIIVMGQNFEGHMSNLREVFGRIMDAHLKFNTKKCVLFWKKLFSKPHRIIRRDNNGLGE